MGDVMSYCNEVGDPARGRIPEFPLWGLDFSGGLSMVLQVQETVEEARRAR